MERAFIVDSESKFCEGYKDYKEKAKAQKEVVNHFMEEKGIQSTRFNVYGEGSYGIPFGKRNKKGIRFGIIPTIADKEKFGKYLKSPSKNGLCYFKANSAITKEFAQKCVDSQIVINLSKPDFRDYFLSMAWNAYTSRYFQYNGIYYASVNCDTIDPNETPEGFTEIKLSELYKAIESVEEKTA